MTTLAIGTAYLHGWLDVAHDSLAADAPAQLAGTMIGSALVPEPRDKPLDFAYCHRGGGQNCVVDGDTIWLRGEKIRIADIDTPETHDFQCAEEKALGDRATERLRELLQGGTISLGAAGRDTDQYGRKLRIVMVDGESVGETLVDEGLARWYRGERLPWCGAPPARPVDVPFFD